MRAEMAKRLCRSICPLGKVCREADPLRRQARGVPLTLALADPRGPADPAPAPAFTASFWLHHLLFGLGSLPPPDSTPQSAWILP